MSGMRQFRNDRRGNFGVVLAAASVPLVMSAGVAVDLSSVHGAQTKLQNALDAAVLSVAREGNDISDSQALEVARAFLAGNSDISPTELAVDRSGTSVTLRASYRQPLAFSGVFGYSYWPVGGTSTADIAFMSYEISLVLDTTGSMRGGKLTSMQNAVYGLIDGLSDHVSDPEKLRFSLVPFATFVNVGPEHGPEFDKKGKIVKGTGAQWLDLNGKSPIDQTELVKGASRFEIYHTLGLEWKGCVETRQPSKKGAHDVDDTPATRRDRYSLFVPAFAIDEPDTRGFENSYIESDVDPLDQSLEGKAKKLKKYGLNGIAELLGLGGGYDVGQHLKDTPSGGGSGKTEFRNGKGPNHRCDTQPITPLTNDYADLKRKVRALEAQGNTNIMEGVAWGMRVLSPHEPFGQGQEDKPGVEKIMIVLTDGSNVFGNKGNRLGSSYTSFGYLVDRRLGIAGGSSRVTTNRMNEKTLAACQNAKDDGIEIYTIRLEDRDRGNGEMLEKCATSPGHYFDTPSRRQLDRVFDRIKDGIVKLRISA